MLESGCNAASFSIAWASVFHSVGVVLSLTQKLNEINTRSDVPPFYKSPEIITVCIPSQ